MTVPYKPIFFVGNKRSGTTLLTYMLNRHRKIFILNEGGILWRLINPERTYQVNHTDVREKWMCSRFHDLPEDIREAWFIVLLRFLTPAIVGITEDYAEKDPTNLEYIGDKVPDLHLNPTMLEAMQEYFPDAYYIHMVRHPVRCVASMWGTFWKGVYKYAAYGGEREDNIIRGLNSIADVARHWVNLEQRTLHFLSAIPEERVIFCRYEDLCDDPVGQISKLFVQLKLDPENLDEQKRGGTGTPEYARQFRWKSAQVPAVDGLRELAEAYGYVDPLLEKMVTG